MPVISFIIGHASLSNTNTDSTTKVYIYPRSNDELSMAIINNLTSLNGDYSFEVAPSEDEIKDDVEHFKAQCGYILEENQIELAKNGASNGNIILVERMGNARTDIVNEIFYGVYFREYAKYYSKEYIQDYSDNFSTKYDEHIQQLMDNFSVTKITTEKPVANEDFARNILAVIVCLWGFVSVSKFITDKNKGILIPVPNQKEMLFRVLYFSTELVIIIPFMFLSVCLQNNHKGFLFEFNAILLYIIAITATCVLCSYVIKKRQTVLCILPFLTIIYILVCPVFVSLANYFPIVKILRYLCLPYYYLKSF